MDAKETYFARALAWSIKSDFEFVKWLIDTRAFPPEAIPNASTRRLYIATTRAYAKLAPSGILPTVDDIEIELSKIEDREFTNRWLNAIDTMEAPGIGQQRDIANALCEEYDRRRVVGYIDNWLNGVKGGTVKGTITRNFADMSDKVIGMLVGGDATGRPRDILEAARAQRLSEPQSTGYSRLDRALDGGWYASKFYICGMPSGHGKTSACCNFASRRCEAGRPTIIHSLEMPAQDLLFRMLCDLAEVPLEVAENPNAARGPDEYERVSLAESMVDRYVRVYDTPADSVEMGRRIRRHSAEFPGEIILNEIDHIGIVRRNSYGSSEWAELESMAYSLVQLAKTSHSPILAYSQVPTEVEQELVQNNIIVYNKDFRGSRGIRNAVDVAIMGCKHSGVVGGILDNSYWNHSVIQVVKNRRSGKQFWGVFKYDPIHYRLMNTRDPGTRDDIY